MLGLTLSMNYEPLCKCELIMDSVFYTGSIQRNRNQNIPKYVLEILC